MKIPKQNKEWNEDEWPKFILATQSPRPIVVHLHRPRFAGKVHHAEDGSIGIEPNFIDDPELDAIDVARLMRETGDWYRELTNFMQQ
ncbi:MAG: hypothetical protein CMM02_18270 [Rhodopirellula sp.]|nr:hypothetical protein [Rhodopirellula sp.]|tara:strand:+ start:910 stop:1170 length:261 start_codon:yes stop_codon:yes gene_type:complete